MAPLMLIHWDRFRWLARAWLLLTAGVLVDARLCGPALAQMAERAVPSVTYHAAFGDFYEGEYKSAMDRFLHERSGAKKYGQMRWIDSICYETMCGECCYEMGYLPRALEHYTAALKLYLSYSNWLLQVQFPATIRPAGASLRKAIPWAVRPPQAPLGQYPTTMLMGQGQIDANETVKHGGVVQQARLYPVEVQEIVRCTTLAIRRRGMLLGPIAAEDPLFSELIGALSRRPGPPNHWSEAWVNLEYGLALMAAGKAGQAVPILQRATLAAGEFVHPLSSIAHLELGRLAVARNDYDTALKHFEEATYGAVYYPDAGVLEEAFRCGTATFIMANRKGIFPPLAAAIQWAKANRLRQLQASLLVLAAENYAVAGNTPQAAVLAEEARVTIGRRTMAQGRMGARRNFTSALVLFQQKKVVEGEAALAGAMTFMREGSFWLNHMLLADNFFRNAAAGQSTSRLALDLFRTVLRDPQPSDWAADPMEALAVLCTPHPLFFEHWFEVAWGRKDYEVAIEAADRTRRHRFFSTLEMGGRLESLRWVLEGPVEMLGQDAQLQRQDLLARYPAYSQLSQQAAALRAQLAAMPPAPAEKDAEILKKQGQVLGDLAKLGLAQEMLLREMAVRREPAAMAFPPARTTAEIQHALPKGQALLIFFATSLTNSPAMYGFVLSKDRYGWWKISLPLSTLTHHAVGLLREMGNYQQNHEITLKDLADAKWKTMAQELLDGLLKTSTPSRRVVDSKDFDELIIVPDGVLWYVPFEALQVNVDGGLRPLISRFRLRYVPTASLATSPITRGHKSAGKTGVVLGRLFPRQEEAAVQAAYTQLAEAVPGCVALRSPLPVPSAVYAGLLDRLIVLDEVNTAADAPLGWSPLPLDRGKQGSTLADWMRLPWGHPDEVILPGFHTAAEESLKRVGRGQPGNEVFLSACGLMASGARTVLLSRWRTGGQTSYDLVREFAQELPHTSPADAWQRAVLVLAASRVNLEAEPRIKRTATDEAPRANHPFFWAGYALVDSGTPPAKADAAPAPPVVIEKKPELPAAQPKEPEKVDVPEPKAAAEPKEPPPPVLPPPEDP